MWIKSKVEHLQNSKPVLFLESLTCSSRTVFIISSFTSQQISQTEYPEKNVVGELTALEVCLCLILVYLIISSFEVFCLVLISI